MRNMPRRSRRSMATRSLIVKGDHRALVYKVFIFLVFITIDSSWVERNGGLCELIENFKILS